MRRPVLLSFIFFNVLVSAQPAIRHNLPPVIPAGSTIDFTVSIDKGSYSGFANYMMEVPDNVTIREDNVAGGSFNFREGRVSVAWPIAPRNEKVLLLKMKMRADGPARDLSISQKYIYVVNDTRTVLQGEAIQISVSDSGALAEAEPAMQNPDDLRQQVVQLKKDAREATRIGELEKKDALERLAAARADSAEALKIKDASERKVSVNEALSARDKALGDIETAEKILALAAELEQNAIEIEKLNVTSDTSGAPPKPDSPATAHSTVTASQKERVVIAQQGIQMRHDAREASKVGQAEKKNAEKKITAATAALKAAAQIKDPEKRKLAEDKAISQKKAAEADLAIADRILALAHSMEENARELDRKSPHPASPVSETVPPAAVETESVPPVPPPVKNVTGSPEATAHTGPVFRLQIGSFTKNPDRTAFQSLGKVDIIQDGDRYRAYYGSFSTIEEARAAATLIAAKGFPGGFPVTFENGKRVK